MEILHVFRDALAALASPLRRLLGGKRGAGEGPERFILEEAVVTVAVAPGLAGRAELCGPGAAAELPVRAAAANLAFARGSRVRIIDYREGSFLVEAADEAHLVR